LGVLSLIVLIGAAFNDTRARGQDELEFCLVDEFDGKFDLVWEPLRHDPTHASLAKNKGNLTITTQAGTLGFNETRSSAGPAKNLFLIANPAADGGDFVLTTCIDSFQPTMKFQQAGLLIYDDDDNYLKCDMEWSGSGVRFKYMRETNGRRVLDTDMAVPQSDRIWIRITKKGNMYERLYSTDGKAFVSAGARDWGDGSPKWIGIVAKNGPTDADSIDAVFDSFEVRVLTDPEKSKARYMEAQKFQGKWKVVACEHNGKPLQNSGLTALRFGAGSVTIIENDKSLRVEYSLDLTKSPREIVLSSFSRESKRPVNGICELEGEALAICLALAPDAPAPTELKTTPGDARLLIKLERAAKGDMVDEDA
jgi:uncharacterized protein (TIGR03067 family)